jgi:NADH:ubiquinone oxidoreductase subunit 5 (subunit L)/multisubunit Na+/H+ antiporter MnhA subunit
MPSLAPLLLALSPLPPLLAALALGLGLLFGRLRGEASERGVGLGVLGALSLSLLLALAALMGKYGGGASANVATLGRWLSSGAYHINIGVNFDGLSLGLAVLFASLAWLTARFSINYLHREAGFQRFFMALSLFSGAMLLLVTASSAALAFMGWELAGVSSYLLIAYHYDRPTAAANATRALVTNRVGDAGFVLGIFLAFAWTGGVDWAQINGKAAHLSEWQAGTVAVCFLLAALVKSAQVPFVPWVARALEGPTPSSAIFYGSVMIHAGVYLALRLQPLFEQAPAAMALMAALGLLTAVYGFLTGLAQTDVKSALMFSTIAQVGLMFFLAGLGWWKLAFWHLGAHALFRAYQFLAAPALMHQILGAPARPVPAWLGRYASLYAAVLQRFWLEPLGDWALAKPALRLGSDLQAFDYQVLEQAFGAPAPGAQALRVSGWLGKALSWLAEASHWFEEKLVLQGVGQNLIYVGRRLGVRLNHLEELLSHPRYLVVLILATLLLVF